MGKCNRNRKTTKSPNIDWTLWVYTATVAPLGNNGGASIPRRNRGRVEDRGGLCIVTRIVSIFGINSSHTAPRVAAVTTEAELGMMMESGQEPFTTRFSLGSGEETKTITTVGVADPSAAVQDGTRSKDGVSGYGSRVTGVLSTLLTGSTSW